MDLSRLAAVAYVETEYFGGMGTQAAATYIAGVPTVAGRHTNETGVETDSLAINEALAAIGVRRKGQMDEFDTIGLGRYRHTEDWAGEDGRTAYPPIRNEEARLLDVSLSWRETGDASNPLTTDHGGRVLLLQLNDWPDETHVWTLLADGKPVLFVDDWPPRWRRP